MVAAIVVNVFKPMMRDRYFLPLTPLFTILYMAGFYATFPRLPKNVRLWLPILVMVPFWIPHYAYMYNTPETGTVAIIRQIEERADPQKDLIVVSFPAISAAITFYLPPKYNIVVFPANERTKVNQ